MVPASPLSFSIPQRCPTSPVWRFLQFHAWGWCHGLAEGISSHPLSPALLPPCLWHHPILSIHWLCPWFPIEK